MTEEQIKEQLTDLMQSMPDLNDGGFGYWCGIGLRRGESTEQEQAEAMTAARKRLAGSIDAIKRTIDFLDANVPKANRVNHRVDSYWLKHHVEQRIGYITNGQMIAAAIIAGYPCKVHGGNARFGMPVSAFRSSREVAT